MALTDQGGVDGQRVLKQGAERVGAFDDPQDVVADVAEVTLQLDVDVVLVESALSASMMSSSGLVARWNSITSRDEVVDAPRDGGVPVEELVLDLVDVVLQPGHDRRVLIDDLVHDRVEDGFGAEPQQLRLVPAGGGRGRDRGLSACRMVTTNSWPVNTCSSPNSTCSRSSR